MDCIYVNIVYVKKVYTILFVLQVNDPWEMLGNVLTQRPNVANTETKCGNKFIFTAADYFIKWVEGFTLPDKMAAIMVKCFCIFIEAS